jgi:hypothetical protein
MEGIDANRVARLFGAVRCPHGKYFTVRLDLDQDRQLPPRLGPEAGIGSKVLENIL